jgi:putative transposase
MLSYLWTGWRTALVIVKPETVIAWHRRGVRLWWNWKSRCRIGRPTVPANIRTLIRAMAQANPRWGTPRIHGELLKLGIDVCQATVAKYMGRRRQPPAQTWRTFLRNHIGQIVAADFFVVPTDYERSRTHLSLDKDTPIPRPVTSPGDGAAVVAIPEVGGLHHRYERRAA